MKLQFIVLSLGGVLEPQKTHTEYMGSWWFEVVT